MFHLKYFSFFLAKRILCISVSFENTSGQSKDCILLCINCLQKCCFSLTLTVLTYKDAVCVLYVYENLVSSSESEVILH